MASLNKALKEGDLLERAREVLKSYDSSTNGGEKSGFEVDTSLRRVCWCLLVDKIKSSRE